MGINGLYSYLKKKHPSILHQDYLINICFGKKILVDIASYIYKYKAVYKEKWLKPFISFLLFFKKCNIHNCFIFDGKAPALKDEEAKRRFIEKEKLQDKADNLYADLEEYKNTGKKTPFLIEIMKKIIKNRERGKKSKYNQEKVKKLLHKKEEEIKEGDDIYLDVDMLEGRLKTIEGQIFSITEEDIWKLKTILNYLGIGYVQANTEAETLACYLCNQGKGQVVVSEDSDALAYLNDKGISISKIDVKKGTCVVIYKSELLEEFDMTREQFIDFCILCGCDYNENIKSVGPVGAEKYAKKYKTIEKFMKKVNDESKKKKLEFDRIAKYKEIRDVFNHTTIPMGRFYINDQVENKFHNNKEEKFEVIESIPIWNDKVDLEKAFDYLESLNIEAHKEIKEAWKFSEELQVEIEFVE